MAKARRSSGSKKKSRGWLWLLTGLLLGAALMYGVQIYLYKDGKPFRGLAGLFAAARKPAGSEDNRPPQPDAGSQTKPKLDFYTILPGETVLPEPKGDKRPAKAEPPEKGVSYVLQAASYGNAEDADRLKARLALNGLEAHIENVAIEGKGAYYRVRLGPYSKLEDLDAASNKLGGLGIKAMRIRVKKGAG
jgi:cell division protein FtsN